MSFCQKQGIHLVSDEIYALSVYDSGDADAAPFTSILSLDPSALLDSKYLHVLYGMSKVRRAPRKSHSIC